MIIWVRTHGINDHSDRGRKPATATTGHNIWHKQFINFSVGYAKLMSA